MTTAPRMGPAEWGLLILLSLVWGGSFLFGRIAVQEVPPMTLVLLRVGLAAVALNLWLLFCARHAGRLPWRNFLVMGLLNNIVPFGLIFIGQQEIGAGLAAIVNALTPVWSMLFAHRLTADERLSTHKVVGVALGLAGVAVLVGSAAWAGLSASAWAQLAVVGATISYGLASVFGRRFAGLPAVQTARGQLTASTLLMIPIAAVADRFWTLTLPGVAATISIILLAVVCTAWAYILFFTILQRAGAVNAALVTLLIPPSAAFLGFLFLGETLALRHLAGMALILAGLIAIDGRLAKRLAWR